MANLAIRGHKTRGNEVVELLEMLGGKNTHDYICNIPDYAYSINEQGMIEWFMSHIISPYAIFTLEEFLEKFPYKVGDRVMTDDGDKANIVGMVWDNDINDVFYETQICNEVFKYPKELLQPYKKGTMGKRQYEELRMPLDDDDKLSTEVTIGGNKILPPNNYLIGKVTQVDNGMLVEFVKKQPQYPKTYKECCDVLGLSTMDNDAKGYKDILIIQFQELLIARDAYWKIAGEQMWLGKPWKPDWLNVEQDKFVLYTHDNVICLNRFVLGHNVLAFPTEEMRDAFYENFKDLIEHVKELL